MSTPKIAGIPLPLAAAGAAGAGWLVGHLASRQEAAAIEPAAPTPPATIDNPSASLDFGQDLGPGVLPGVSPWGSGGGIVGDGDGGGYDDGYGGAPIPIPPGPSPTPVPVTPPATTPPPSTAPPPTTVAGTNKLLCKENFRFSATTSSTLLTQLPAGTIVTVVARVTGSSWTATNVCVSPHKTYSGSSWYRVSHINGKTVKSLYGTTYGYLATALVGAR